MRQHTGPRSSPRHRHASHLAADQASDDQPGAPLTPWVKHPLQGNRPLWTGPHTAEKMQPEGEDSMGGPPNSSGPRPAIGAAGRGKDRPLHNQHKHHPSYPQPSTTKEPMTTNPRSTRQYVQWRARVLKHCEPICIRCGDPVDLELPRTHPLGASADHEPPLAETGEIAPSLDQSGIAHLQCNRSHGGRIGSARALANKKQATNTTTKRTKQTQTRFLDTDTGHRC